MKIKEPESFNDGDLNVLDEINYFIFPTNDNVDEAILKYINLESPKHPNGVSSVSLYCYFVYKTSIMSERRLRSRLANLVVFKILEKVELNGYGFYRKIKDEN
jgi:hypothetical protein